MWQRDKRRNGVSIQETAILANCCRTDCGLCGVIFVYLALIMAFYGNSIASFPGRGVLAVFRSVIDPITSIWFAVRRGSCAPVTRSIQPIDRTIDQLSSSPSTDLLYNVDESVLLWDRGDDLSVNNSIQLTSCKCISRFTKRSFHLKRYISIYLLLIDFVAIN